MTDSVSVVGQLLAIVETRRIGELAIRFELDRSLTGMGIEVYTSSEEARGEKTSELLARRLFETGLVVAMSTFSNVVTVTTKNVDAGTFETLTNVITGLFTHYLPGVEPTPV